MGVSGDLNSGPHVCTESTLTIELLGQFVLKCLVDHGEFGITGAPLGCCNPPYCMSPLLITIHSLVLPRMSVSLPEGTLGLFPFLWLSGAVYHGDCHPCHLVLRKYLVIVSSKQDSALQCDCPASRSLPKCFLSQCGPLTLCHPCGESLPQKQGTSGHMTSTVRKQSKCSVYFFPSHAAEDPAHRVAPPTFSVGLLTSGNLN